MPSAHGATVCSLAVSVGITAGVESHKFALAVVFALVMMYDFCGGCLEAGRHACALNILSNELDSLEEPLCETDRSFREVVGHTIAQVV